VNKYANKTFEEATMIFWTLIMQKCGLSITLQQLEMKVAKFTQTRPIHHFEMVYQEHLAALVQALTP
jgi:hypothetical protein